MSLLGKPILPIALLWLVLAFATPLTADDAVDGNGPDAKQQRRTYERAVLIKVEGPITPFLEQYVRRSLARARKREADMVIVEIDSPGGYLDASLNLANLMAETDWATTVAYVPRQAFSGAAIMSLGCKQIILHPAAQFGDAGPIFQGEDAAFRHAPEKIRSALAVQLREIARSQGRSPALAEAMVDMNMKVFRVRDKQTGDELLMTERELDAVVDPQRWETIQRIAETGDGRFLTLNGRRTVEVGLGDGLAEDRASLKILLGIVGDIEIIERNAVDVVVLILNHPIITGLLIIIGLVALFVEFSAPGLGVGGIISALCFMIFFWSRFLGGTADWLEVVLFLGGLMCLAAEFFVIPGFGFAGVAGTLLMISSIILASQTFVIPRTERQLDDFRESVTVAALSGIAFAGAAVWVTRRTGKIPILSRMALQPSPSDDERTALVGARTKNHPQPNEFNVGVGDVGIAESPLRPAGRARFGESYVDVVTDGTFVAPGDEVCVIEVSGNHVRVRKVDI
jgi:membrane-bound serine protease (ClpP class)